VVIAGEGDARLACGEAVDHEPSSPLGFGELIAAIEAGAVDVVIVRDIDRLTRNLTDWKGL